ncbi:MAG: hypothetical protein K2L71_00875 [Muribaculaceae bacterium]|nr:hypothetical protein [Muribaculaceae bacterium]
MIQKTLLAVSMLFSGFASAGAAKPDFAFPKQVSITASKELKTAIKSDNGPGTMRALINLTLAGGLMEPDSIARLEHIVADVTARTGNPVTKAMTMLLRAEISGSAQWADSALVYTDALRGTDVGAWGDVISVNKVYMPTLYDFAVSKRLDFEMSDSLLRQICEFHAGDLSPLMYWSLYSGSDSDAWKLYDGYFQKWQSFYPLVWLQQMHGQNNDESRRIFDAAVKWIDMHSATAPHEAVTQVKRVVGALTAPRVKLLCRTTTRLADPLPVHIESQNAGHVEIAVYETKPLQRLVKKYDLRFDGEGMFANDTTIEVTLPRFGNYRIVPLLPGGKEDLEGHSCEVVVSDFLVEVERFGRVNDYMAIDPMIGKPQSDVKFSLESNRLSGTRGDDIYSPTVWCGAAYEGYPSSESWRQAANVLTDRSIYHPGDSVRFVTTVYEYDGLKRRIKGGAHHLVTLFDANGKEVASVDGITDNMGRLHGVMPIPESVMTGYFRVAVERIGSVSVMVSDYKAPEFEVTARAVRVDSVTVNISGTAFSYSGFPVQDGSVRISIDKLSPWVWFWDFRSGIQETVAETDAKTDISGRFSVNVNVPAGVALSARATVTSALGESHDADCFIPGKPYYIKVSLPENLLAPENTDWIPPVEVVDAEGKSVELALNFSLITSENDTIASVKDWSKVPSGQYSLIVSADNSEFADNVTVSNLVIYRADDKMPPVKTPLWVPSVAVSTGEDVMYGTSFDESYIRYVLWTPDSVLEKKWLSPGVGNHSFKAELPDGINDATITLWAFRDYAVETRSVTVKRRDVARNLKLEISSLRDRINVGDRELWTIKVVDNLGRPAANSAVVLDVYSKALDALQPFSMAFNPYSGPSSHYWISPGSWYPQSAIVWKNGAKPQLPDVNNGFNTYGQRWPRVTVFYHIAGMGQSAMARNYKTAITVDSAPMAMEEAVYEESGSLADSGNNIVKGSHSESSAEGSYRLPEVPLALWQPVLTTDADGALQVQFVAPDANTTWSLKAVAYDSNLLTGTFGADIIASKPVMVQTSLPRFMRQGDMLTLRASAVNNTDSVVGIGAVIELYDPITGDIIESKEFQQEAMKPMSTRILSLPLTVGSDWNCLGIRVRASGGNFSDGEQTVIPVLPSTVTVLESTPILIDADSTVTVIDAKPGSVMQLTSNAVWECVMALPGVIEYNNSSLLAALSSLFSAATADGLSRSYPEIRKAIRQWENTDSLLMSRLMKNEDLKIALLENTPWIGAAEADTERMARLSLLLDKARIKKTIDNSITTMAKLTRGGGLCWVDGDDEPSEWMTLCALSTLGQLKKMGYLPSDRRLDKIIREALKYIDNVVARKYAADKHDINMTYAYVRTAFADVVSQPSTARKVSAAAVQHAVANWRDYSLKGRAQAALFLNDNGYHTTAMKIVESLRQYSAWRQTGVTPWVLEAFAGIDPSSADVDVIRLWLLSQKQTQEWGQGYYTSSVVYSILSSGTDWLVPAANELSVKIDGKDVDVTTEDSYVGEFRLDIPDGGAVTVTKGRFPAWGGIWNQSESKADSVAPSTGKELKISREIEGDLTVGSRVNVILTIDADRPMDYVTVVSPHCAGMQPVNQLPHNDGWRRAVYTEPTAQRTTFFINRLPKGRTVIREEYYVTGNGSFILAPAQAQSQYAPEFIATSSGIEVTTQ